MLKRSDVRNACFRAKVGDWRESQKEIQDTILSLRPPYATWDNFTTEWDVTVSKSGEIVVIKPEVNADYIFKVCSDASMKSKNKLPWEWSNREKNIIDIVESEMLDNITSWDNFFDVWTTEVDIVLKRIHVKLLNKPLGQRQIEVHEYEPKPVEEPILKPDVNELNFEPMTEEEIKTFEKMLKKTKRISK